MKRFRCALVSFLLFVPLAYAKPREWETATVLKLVSGGSETEAAVVQNRAMKLDPQILDATAALITALATILLVIATLLLAALAQALNVQNEVILSSEENLKTAEALIAPPGVDQSIAKIRERYICFLLLNVQALIFATRHQDKSFEDLWAATHQGILDRLLKNDTVMHLLRTRGYTPDFVKYCEERRKTLLQPSAT